jgi:hypothetical protein
MELQGHAVHIRPIGINQIRPLPIPKQGQNEEERKEVIKSTKGLLVRKLPHGQLELDPAGAF